MADPRIVQELLDQSNTQAGQVWPRLTAYAPNVGQETLSHRPDFAGRFDPETRSVLLNNARTTPLTPPQATGLVGLERTRGHLASPVGRQWTDAMPLPEDQRQYWDAMYLPQGVDAPTDQAARDRILKSTIMSRMLVGDSMPEGAPALTPEQEGMGALYSSYARGRK